MKERFLVKMKNILVILSILQSQFIEKGFKKTKNVECNVLLLILFTVVKMKNRGILRQNS